MNAIPDVDTMGVTPLMAIGLVNPRLMWQVWIGSWSCPEMANKTMVFP
jgi:hypothetical protein